MGQACLDTGLIDPGSCSSSPPEPDAAPAPCTPGLSWAPCGMQVEKELSEICSSILQLLDDHLIPTASSGESKVFYLKMKGDYHRYLAEFKSGTDRKDAAEHTLLAYKAAQVQTRLALPPRILAFVSTRQPAHGAARPGWGGQCGDNGDVKRVERQLACQRLCPGQPSSQRQCWCRTSPWWTWRPLTPSGWAWHSTSPSSTTRSSIRRSVPAIWPSRWGPGKQPFHVMACRAF
jgi:hypothetical protein